MLARLAVPSCRGLVMHLKQQQQQQQQLLLFQLCAMGSIWYPGDAVVGLED